MKQLTADQLADVTRDAWGDLAARRQGVPAVSDDGIARIVARAMSMGPAVKQPVALMLAISKETGVAP